MNSASLSRRRFLLDLVKSGTLLMLAPPLLDAWRRPASAQALDAHEYLVRMSRPLDLETPLGALDTYLTPADRLFVRSHFGAPELDAATWRLQLEGLVDKPLTLTLDDLKRFKPHTVTAVLQCSGNGRGLYKPKVPGVQWAYGAVGNVRWTGARLSDVLGAAGVHAAGKHVWLQGADRAVLPTAPRFLRSVPMAKALHPDTLLAYEMNGEPLGVLHGFPVRAVVPGWVGDDWMKWLTYLKVSDQEPPGYFFQVAYRYPNHPVAPGTAVDPKQMSPLTALVVKSLIAHPQEGDELTTAEQVVRGVAWTGNDARIKQVEVSLDGGKSWSSAELYGPDEPYAWRQWRLRWKPKASGTYSILARATDSAGHTQPAISPWNPSGFLWNGYHGATVRVRA